MEELSRFKQELPFDERYVQSDKTLRPEQYPGYESSQEHWRSIDDDWLNLASDLALQLDSLTNNTSLVLAIERLADGKVLLFPADAQQGNWLSWHEPPVEFTVADAAGKTRKVTAADLLARTVFYKVGHHASHNATARGQGLELMTQQEELTAFIPVDRQLALTRNPKGSWQMPARPLYRRLLEKCQGRVVRSDLGWAVKPTASQAAEDDFKSLATDKEWNEWKKSQQAAKHIVVGDLYVEYLLT
jgi:Lhr-like helicase